MNDTPETDEQINGKPCTRFEVIVGNSLRDAWVPSEFARKLERERDRYKSDVEVITKERDEARKAVALIAEDCEAWLRSESDEPSAEFIKLVAKYARNHLTTPAQ